MVRVLGVPIKWGVARVEEINLHDGHRAMNDLGWVLRLGQLETSKCLIYALSEQLGTVSFRWARMLNIVPSLPSLPGLRPISHTNMRTKSRLLQ